MDEVTDRPHDGGWNLVCHRCGEKLINHTVYLDEPDPAAIEGQFDGPMHGFYCLPSPGGKGFGGVIDDDA